MLLQSWKHSLTIIDISENIKFVEDVDFLVEFQINIKFNTFVVAQNIKTEIFEN